MAQRPILLTGATGFVGRHLYPALVERGHDVRCASRQPERAAASGVLEDADWVRCDLGDDASLVAALSGCRGAYFLVHEVSGSSDYPEREAAHARAFGRAAAAAGVERIVYLGGVAPRGIPSRHLASRIHTGRCLREGGVPVFELRAAMIIGHGSSSWTVVRDLASRLPAMILPRWLRNHSWPVAIDDVVAALAASVTLPVKEAGIYDLPGPERLSHRDALVRSAELIHHRRPRMVGVPLLTPRLSSYWIGLVSGVPLALASELVAGLQSDLDPSQPILWPLVGLEPMGFDAAVKAALVERAA